MPQRQRRNTHATSVVPRPQAHREVHVLVHAVVKQVRQRNQSFSVKRIHRKGSRRCQRARRQVRLMRERRGAEAARI
jgi:hypothetical protein